jgi:hypothetical protein
MDTTRLTQKELNMVKKLYTESIPEDFSGTFPISSYHIDESTEIIVGEKRRDNTNCILQDAFRFRRRNIYIYSIPTTTGENDDRR